MKIAVYTITKNEEQFIPRWAESAKDADYRLIVDTGSTDKTVQMARDNGCDVATISVSPWRFDDARNAAMALLPADVDWCVSLDADEVLQPGWRQHLEALPENVTRPRYKYVWSWNPDGTEGLVFHRDHIHRRKHYRWKHPVHEILVCTATEVQAVCGLEVHHHPDATKSRSQYLPLLELAVKEDPKGDRNMFYLAREFMYNNRYEEATPYFMRHLEISTWNAERAASMRYLAKVTGNREPWLLKACAEAPERREGWVDLAQYYYDTQQWLSCYSAAKRALAITDKPLDYICEPLPWGETPHDLAAISAWNIGLYKEAIRHGETALSLKPTDARLSSNLRHYLMSGEKHPVTVIIPTKSNTQGLVALLDTLREDDVVCHTIVVADGQSAYDRIKDLDGNFVTVLKVKEASGIHAMWNHALTMVGDGGHVFFLNDDVTLESNTASILSATLSAHPDIGLISPNYDGREVRSSFVPVFGATGVYGKTGIAGASMMLNKSLVSEWRFDERMKWYFGDDDIARWVFENKAMITAVSGLTRCHGNDSWTIQNDPPPNFKEDTDRDYEIFKDKWGL